MHGDEEADADTDDAGHYDNRDDHDTDILVPWCPGALVPSSHKTGRPILWEPHEFGTPVSIYLTIYQTNNPAVYLGMYLSVYLSIYLKGYAPCRRPLFQLRVPGSDSSGSVAQVGESLGVLVLCSYTWY